MTNEIQDLIQLLIDHGAKTNDSLLDALCDGELLNAIGIHDEDLVENTFYFVQRT